MSSGLRYTPADPTGHIATPRSGTCVREADGKPGDPLTPAHYPVAAECKVCGGWIRLDHVMQMDWHVPAASGPARPPGRCRIIPGGLAAPQRPAWPLVSTLPPLAPFPAAPLVARGHVGVTCTGWNLATLAEDGQAVVSELATNAVSASMGRTATRAT